MTSQTRLKIVITAGPTREPLDSVRFISNYSTGTIGYLLAAEAVRRGHQVVLISGPVSLKAPEKAMVVKVESARQMYSAVKKHFKLCHCLIMSAAVSDYRPKKIIPGKLKKTKKSLSLELVRNPDILKQLAKIKKDRITVGFALEASDLIPNACRKLREKNLDLIVANKKTKGLSPFGKEKPSGFFIDGGLKAERFTKIQKKALAGLIIDKIEKLWYTHNESKGGKVTA
ncbi:MAG: phosphopantothenoylcysteine decarboxylase [Candidatus Omnitrophica bacterium]|nr:phosphopantothenoylcysteine decarboxylase [Candidatus Omnitrophota bacterium]